MRLERLLLFIFWALPRFGKNQYRTLQISETQTLNVKEEEKLLLKRQGVRYFDITNFPSLFKTNEVKTVPEYVYPVDLINGDRVSLALTNVSTKSMYDDLAFFTSFYTRYYKSETGYDSAVWLSKKLKNVTETLGDKVSQLHIDHRDWKQFSIIVQIRGVKTPEKIVVFGSHQDSMNLILPSVMAAPGADDNGSGTVTNIEALRLYAQYLTETQDWPQNTVEFHFYSAEEGGLLGSLDVFTNYASDNKTVVAMLQQDMTGYVPDPKNEHVGVITDFTTPAYTKFVELVIDKYLSIPFIETECGYACSDHSSATKNGFPAAFVIESEFSKTNKYIHTTMDTLDRLNFGHMAEHVKLIIGTIIELSNWEFKLKVAE
ncbi:LANO_0D03334g1_1 [Lachancea nothofagi CBS 11611]|uniref:Peptide hydrolase n=1 Tax=Lachancea nothofagi CBS 11611 TaxID=1266666 RepID=A0A1G4JF59_9SACH|nr:LANO_0D03334g1_1 [Lachancea nothofagi CBS 11611]